MAWRESWQFRKSAAPRPSESEFQRVRRFGAKGSDPLAPLYRFENPSRAFVTERAALLLRDAVDACA